MGSFYAKAGSIPGFASRFLNSPVKSTGTRLMAYISRLYQCRGRGKMGVLP
jgi:hypothetical protein